MPIQAKNGSRKDQLKPTDNLAYIRQMLIELRDVAKGEGADLLCYFIEMAYLEAGDLHSGRKQVSVCHNKGNSSPGVTI